MLIIILFLLYKDIARFVAMCGKIFVRFLICRFFEIPLALHFFGKT